MGQPRVWGANPGALIRRRHNRPPVRELDPPTGSWVSGIGTGANHSDWVWTLGIDTGRHQRRGSQVEDKTTGYLKDAGLSHREPSRSSAAIDSTQAPTAKATPAR